MWLVFLGGKAFADLVSLRVNIWSLHLTPQSKRSSTSYAHLSYCKLCQLRYSTGNPLQRTASPLKMYALITAQGFHCDYNIKDTHECLPACRTLRPSPVEDNSWIWTGPKKVDWAGFMVDFMTRNFCESCYSILRFQIILSFRKINHTLCRVWCPKNALASRFTVDWIDMFVPYEHGRLEFCRIQSLVARMIYWVAWLACNTTIVGSNLLSGLSVTTLSKLYSHRCTCWDKS